MSGEARQHPDEETLHRLAERRSDGAAPTDAELGRARAHLEGCEACRAEVAGIRRVLRAAERLPPGLPPDGDLWPGVEARVRTSARAGRDGPAGPDAGGAGAGGTDAGRAGRPARRSAPLRRAAPWLAAAAAVLVAVTAGATLWLTGGDAPGERATAAAPAGTPGAGSGSAVPAAVRGVRSGYRPLVDRLQTVLERRRGELPPRTRRVVERNLEIIDAAIAETEAALAENPSSPELLRALDRTYDRKVELLRRSASLAARL